MDPGAWSTYTYNGLSAAGVAPNPSSFASAAGQRVSDFQLSSGAMGSQPGASQLILGMSPAAAAVAAAANSSFLSSNYEPVFSSLFHHSAQKSQYGALNVAHHRQSLVKPGDSELSAAAAQALRDNYMHQSVATSSALYEQSSALNWSQANTSLGSPFGILPHESVSSSSKSSSSDKKGHMFSEGSSTPYENTFSAHLSPPFAHGYTNSQLSAAAADYRNSGMAAAASYEAAKKVQKTTHEHKPPTTSSTWQGAFSQVTPASSRDCASLPPPPATSFAPSHAQKVQAAANFASRAEAAANFASRAAAAAIASSAANAHQQQSQQSCIVSTLSKDYAARQVHHQVPPNLPFVPQHRPSSVPTMQPEKPTPRSNPGFSAKPSGTHIPTKAQTKIFSNGPLDASMNSAVIHESSQSPRYGLDANHNFSSSSTSVPPTPSPVGKTPAIPQAHQRAPFPPPSSAHLSQYRNYPSPDAAAVSVTHTAEYQRSTPDSIALSPYSDSEHQHCHNQNGGSSSSSVMGRPSPTQTSPLSHTPSPAYPIYNSPMSAPSPLHEAQSCVYSKPTSASQAAAYSSVIQCNSSAIETKSLTHSRQNFSQTMKQSWEMQDKRTVRDMPQSQSAAVSTRFPFASESMDVLDVDSGILAGNSSASSMSIPEPQQQRQSMYEPSSINLQDLAVQSNDDMLAMEKVRSETADSADDYDRRRGRKIKRRKSGEKVKQQQQQQQQQPPPQNCSYPPLHQNGYFPPGYHENFMGRNNTIAGYHPRLNFNPTHSHCQPSPAHSQCGPNPVYQNMGTLPLSMQGPSSSSASSTPPAPTEKPALAGPSVEDELGFLEDTQSLVPQQNAPSTSSATNSLNKPLRFMEKKDDSGFMESYLKFLRGETETPLTVNVRAGRKSPKGAQFDNRERKANVNTIPLSSKTGVANNTPMVNKIPPAKTNLPESGSTSTLPTTSILNKSSPPMQQAPTMSTQHMSPTCHTSEPLKKMQNESLLVQNTVTSAHSSVTPIHSTVVPNHSTMAPIHSSMAPTHTSVPVRPQEMSSCLLEERKTPKQLPYELPPMQPEMRGRSDTTKVRGVANVGASSSHRGRGRPPKRAVEESSPEAPLKAVSKPKVEENCKSTLVEPMSPAGDLDESSVSDSDPAWTPTRKDYSNNDSHSEEEVAPVRRSLRKYRESAMSNKPRVERKHTRSYPIKEEPLDTISDTDCLMVIKTTRKSHKSNKKPKGKKSSRVERALKRERRKKRDKTFGSIKDDGPVNSVADKLFTSGTFVVSKKYVDQDHPPLWRLDGKNLIQKYESYKEDGKIYYRNVSTYSGWSREKSCLSYEPVEITFIKQTRLETIVQLTRNDAKKRELAMKKRFMLETKQYDESFGVYIQTLASHVLDQNFIPIILRENDEYFVSNVEKIDKLAEKKISQLKAVLKLPADVEARVTTWPSYKEAKLNGKVNTICTSCGNSHSNVKLHFHGETYNPTTLTMIEPDSESAHQKVFEVCPPCLANLDILSRLIHLKYNYFKTCVTRVNDTQILNPNITDTSDLLQEVLSGGWISKLFQGLQEFWAEVDFMVYQLSST